MASKSGDLGHTPLRFKPAKEKKVHTCRPKSESFRCGPQGPPRCPVGIFIELSMKSFGACVSERKKYLFQGCRGPWLLHKLLPGTAKKIRRGIPGASCPYTHPCGSVRPPDPFVAGKFEPTPPHLANLGVGVRFVALSAVLYPHSRQFFVTWKTPHPPLEPGGLGWAEASGPICESSLRMI